jgi:hypothetical protein
MLRGVIENRKTIPVGDTRAKADIKGFFFTSRKMYMNHSVGRSVSQLGFPMFQ